MQLNFSALPLNPLLLGLSTKGLRATGLEVSSSGGLDSSASLGGSGSFLPMVVEECAPVDAASFGD